MNWEEYRKEIEAKGAVPEDWYILGIDLGTTNSVISYWDDGAKKPESIDTSNGFGKIPMPSVAQYRPEDEGEGEWVVGEEAHRSFKIYPETTIRSIKRKMGTNETVEVGGEKYLPEEISAKILRELVDYCASLNPKAEIAGLVVSVPYDFDDAAKKATMRACEIAGLADKLICLMEEPKAAALAYNFRRELAQDEKILVFDFGGGTLDITLFHVVEKTEGKIVLQVISEGGEAHHGGDNIDDMILARCLALIKDKIGQDAKDIPPENSAELILRSREAKERLSGVKSFRIPFTFCIPPFVEQITRDQFEELISDFIEKTRKLVQKALREAYTGAVYPDSIDRVLLEGGSSQMPWVKDMFIEIFNDESKIYTSERPALDISLGATYYAAMKMGLLSSPDMEAQGLGVNVEFEVTVPHDIGLEIQGGRGKQFFPMIRRGTPYALAKKNHVFTLSGALPEDMTQLDLRILERIDKDDKLEDCKLIGEVAIRGLPGRPSGKTRLKVTLLVEEEGGLVKGAVEDMGFGEEFAASGYNETFDPSRFIKRIVGEK
ncbi:MAG: Hsp70 family protein [Clostridiales bacterium]|jgi:molecular chaperone DnaK|nr:Hsp70 family protein [Clostridiales bacterium]